MKIRVLHIIDHLGFGGAPIALKNIVEGISNEHIETFVCALRTNPTALPVNAQIINLTYHRYDPRTILAIVRLCRKYDINIIHAHLQKSIITSLLAGLLYRKGKIIIHEHGGIFCKGTGCIYRLLLKLLAGKATLVIANSQAAKKALLKTTFLNDNKIEVLSNFIDFSRFDCNLYDPAESKKLLNISGSETVVGFVGRLDYYKGADLILDAAAKILEKDSNYIFVIVGDGKERTALENKSRRLRLQQKVIFTGTHKNPAQIMRAFDIGLIPSRCEAFGIVAVEFMRMKIPVIASAVGGLVEVVQHEQTGILLDHLRAENIADAIDKLAKDKPLQEKFTENAEVFSRKFDGREQLKQITSIYEELCP